MLYAPFVTQHVIPNPNSVKNTHVKISNPVAIKNQDEQ